MDNIPTAKQLFSQYSSLYSFEEGPSEYLIDEEAFIAALIEFNRLHVKAALEAANHNLPVVFDANGGSGEIREKCRETILSAYPENLIV